MSLDDLRKRANELVKAGRHDEESIAVNTEILQLDPRNYKAHLWRGRANRECKRYEAAVEDFEQASRLVPGSTEARRELKVTRTERQMSIGKDQARAEKRKQVEEQLARSKQWEPRAREQLSATSDHEEAFSLGKQAQSKELYELAVSSYRKAYALDGGDYILTKIGAVCRASGLLGEAIEIYGRLLSKSSLNERTWASAKVGLAACYTDSGKLPESEKLCQEVLKRYMRAPFAARTLARVYSKQGRHEEAWQVWQDHDLDVEFGKYPLDGRFG